MCKNSQTNRKVDKGICKGMDISASSAYEDMRLEGLMHKPCFQYWLKFKFTTRVFRAINVCYRPYPTLNESHSQRMSGFWLLAPVVSHWLGVCERAWRMGSRQERWDKEARDMLWRARKPHVGLDFTMRQTRGSLEEFVGYGDEMIRPDLWCVKITECTELKHVPCLHEGYNLDYAVQLLWTSKFTI